MTANHAHVALRLAAGLDTGHAGVAPGHQMLTKLQCVPLVPLLDRWVRFTRSAVTGFDLAGRLLTHTGALPYTRRMLAAQPRSS